MRVAAIAASLLTLVGVLAAVPASGKARPGAVGFRVTGSVGGMYPGARRFLNLKIRNPYKRPMRLVAVTARVRGPRRACTRWNLDVRPFRGRLVIPRGRARIARLLVRMPRTAAQECNGARFPLVFRARAVVQ
jgi:hypothetical protein